MSNVEVRTALRENMTVGTKGEPAMNAGENGNDERGADSPMSDAKGKDVENELLDHVANSRATFKSQQKGEPELTFEEKRAIAGKLLERSRSLFLSKFGRYLKVDHLEHFGDSQDYETVYHVNRLRRYFNNSARHIDVRNRRYEALRTLVEKSDYFSECEMMKRNPLLYEHLVGQYLTEEEKKARDSVDTQSSNYIDILMETVERDKLQQRLKSQQTEEDKVREDNDSDEDDDSSRNSTVSKAHLDKQSRSRLWGEDLSDTKDKNKDRDKKMQGSKIHKISSQEIKLLRQEFVTNMYQSFLDGKDRDFDYSTVDDNETYDNVELRNQDEEEKYFDSEAPETVTPCNKCNDQNESEDELDVYMRSLKTPTNAHSLDNQT
ncbi:PREDICTED: coiled-coil domain-containing protein 97 isoform X2 [Vollenhovia emeryi]|uniref:coiled-coil domain-containing protein 97 isoform X2 n=1 Tax=Vollenhovia emeryi TaxID=411798 RepID=UPI0005F43F9B|nr:PREDICTED: coiled-coil domain-containing protein 97 isoform X2 [Vollenhovia emeryi]